MAWNKRLAAAMLSLACAGGSAFAASPTAADCFGKEKEAAAALEANAASPNIEEAKMEHRMGRQACVDGRYARGLAHLEKALALLTSK